MKRALAYTLAILVLLSCGVAIYISVIQGPDVEQGRTDLHFSEVPFPRQHEGDTKHSLPFMGLAAVDLDGDGVDEIFVSGGKRQGDGLFRFNGRGFEELTDVGLLKAPGDASFGAASVDATGDGHEDLFVARESGVYFYTNDGEGSFDGQRIQFGLAENTHPLSIALGDVDRNGAVDLFVSGYIKLEFAAGETNFSEGYGGYSYLLLNDGNNAWKDITSEAGLYRAHNTFVSMFIDLDNDGWVDLAVAEDTGVVEIWRNNGDLTFRREPNPTGVGYPMGLGAGDINNDGLVDLYVSNVGPTLPEMMLRGNLPKQIPLHTDYMLLENQGDLRFKDIAPEANAAAYGFGWGVVMADFNNDSRMDLYFAQNYARFPGVKLMQLYPGRLLQQEATGKFAAVESVAGLANQNFGITQVVSDFNRDGWPDLVLGNLDGPVRAFLNDGGERHHLTVQLPDGAIWLNARVTVTLPDGRQLSRQAFAGEGLCSDQGDAVFFGLAESAAAVQVLVSRLDGDERSFTDVPVDQVLQVSQAKAPR